MRPNIYKVEFWGSPEAQGVSETVKVTMMGFAKFDSAKSPWCVANEYVAARLGALFGLPLPPGTIVHSEDGSRRAWVSLSFADRGVKFPPVNPSDVVAECPDLAAGCVVFDALIGNFDRHRQNLAHMPGKKRIEIFDHSHALLGTKDGTVLAAQHLARVRDHLLIDGQLGGSRNCLIDDVADANQLLGWAALMAGALSDTVLGRLCDDVVALDVGVDPELAMRLRLWLQYRRDRLGAMMHARADQFPKIDPNSWWLR